MKFERYKDIPALQGKSREERRDLLKEAYKKDRGIICTRIIMGIIVSLIVAFIPLIVSRFNLEPWMLWTSGLWILCLFIIFPLSEEFFIKPRILRAMEALEKSRG